MTSTFDRTPSGMWDVHARIGGFTGSKLQAVQCPTTPTIATPPAPVNSACIAAYMTMHVTKFGTGIYLENVWLWTAVSLILSSEKLALTVHVLGP